MSSNNNNKGRGCCVAGFLILFLVMGIIFFIEYEVDPIGNKSLGGPGAVMMGISGIILIVMAIVNAANKSKMDRMIKEKAEQERIAREKAERERIAREKAEQERIARQKAEQERIARQKAEQERIAREKAEQERITKEKAEQERIARQKAEQERIAKEKAEHERNAWEKVYWAKRAKKIEEQKRQEKAEQERIAREKAAAEKRTKEMEEERLAQKKKMQDLFATINAFRAELKKEKNSAMSDNDEVIFEEGKCPVCGSKVEITDSVCKKCRFPVISLGTSVSQENLDKIKEAVREYRKTVS